MAVEHFPLLFLDGPSETRGFTTTMQGGGGAALPARVATSHSAILQDRMTRAWVDAEGRQAAGLTTRHGCYIEFVSAPGAELALKSLESVSSGIRLLNVRTNDDGRTLATVFVPSAQRSYFLNRIRDYGDAAKNTRKGNPKNQPLVASIDDIAAAVLKDFWTDRAPLPERDPVWIEVWLATDDVGRIDGFRTVLSDSGIEEHQHHPILRFPERSVLLILADAPQLTTLISRSDLIAELRAARELPTFFLDLSNRDQADWCQNLVSYFIEPGPGEVGWSHRYRYASHGLRFELNSPGETQTEFVKRINKQAREQDEGKPETEAPSDHWVLGQQRNVGSIHSDIWTGRAADLATSNLIAIRPVIGWWRERHHLRRVDQKTRYSLIVSIETPSEETDIYTPVAVKIGIPTPVPIQISIA